MLDSLRRTALFSLTLVLAPVGGAQDGLRTLSPVQMEEDLFLLWETLEREHAGRLRYAEPEELDEVFGTALEACSEDRSALEFFRITSRVISRIRCGHTAANLPPRDETAALARTGLLPFDVHITGERAWILRSLDGSKELEGREIVAIDGTPFPEVRARAFDLLVDDGFIETNKERELERRFAIHYALLVEDPDEPRREHEIVVTGADEPVMVTGITEAAYRQATAREGRPVIHLEFPADDLAHLAVSTFGDPGGDEPTFPEQLEASFREIRERGTKNLALDLRGNGGGRDMYGALLVSYLAKEPFGYFERIEVTPGYEGTGGIVERDGRRLVTTHDGLKVQQPAELAFSGAVYILIDGWTFSTAADVATVAHHNGLATFVGEETGGGYDGNTSGSSERLVLSHSGLGVNVPHWMYTTANVGHAYFGRGAPADHAVRPTVADALAGRDVELELVQRLVGDD